MPTSDATIVETEPRRDELHLPDPVPPEYSENLIMMGYDPTSDYSFYWHFSRTHEDADRWEVLVCIYRPGGEVLVDYGFGSEGNNVDRAGAPQLSFTVEEPLQRWHARYEGTATRTSTRSAAYDLVAADPSVPLAADLIFDGVFPVFSAGAAMDGQDWGDGHLEQGGRVTGTIGVDGETVAIDCLAFRDHTWGRRSYGTLDRHTWTYGFFPSGRVFLVLEAWHDGDHYAQFGFVVQDGQMIRAKAVATPGLEDPQGAPRDFTVQLESEFGEMTVQAEMLHAMSFHLREPIGQPLGTDWGSERNCINVEGPTRVQWNGETGYGWVERTNRAGRLIRPQAE